MGTTVREQIFARIDEDYRKFSSALLPGIPNILGVRLPELHKIAKNIAKGDWRTFLDDAQDEYFEEVMLQGMVIRYAKADLEEILRYVAWFVPKINNWSVCDSFCTGLKFTKKHMQQVWNFLQPYLSSNQEYELRFGIVMLLNYYVEDEYIHAVLQKLNHIKHEGYYVKLAVAWALSICYIKLPERTSDYLADNALDDFTYNKALQKITESYRIAPETKVMLRGMKR